MSSVIAIQPLKVKLHRFTYNLASKRTHFIVLNKPHIKNQMVSKIIDVIISEAVR